MNKYFILLKTCLQKYFYFRSNAFIWIIHAFVNFGIMVVVWTVIYKDNLSVGGYSYSQMISYYLLITLMKEAIYATQGRTTINDDIYFGSLSSYLIKPFSYLKRVLIEEVSKRFIEFTLFLIPFILLFYVFRNIITYSINFYLWPAFVLSLIFGFLICAFLDYIFALAGFWLTETTALFHFKEISFLLLGGLSFPSGLLPLVIRKLNYFLPFYYVFAFPVEIINNNLPTPEIVINLIRQIIWIILLYFIYKIIWKRGLKIYEAAGN